MQKIFLFCLLLFCAGPLGAQHPGRITLGLRAVPGVMTGTSLAFSPPAKGHTTWAIKGEYGTDALRTQEDYSTRTHVFHVDLVYRLRLPLGPKTSWWLDAGVTEMTQVSITPPQELAYCGNSISTPEDALRIAREVQRYATGFSEFQYHAGLALATALERSLGLRWALGVELLYNLYYTPGESTALSPYFSPALNISYAF